MNMADFKMLSLFIVLLLILSPLLGKYMAYILDVEGREMGNWEKKIFGWAQIDIGPQSIGHYIKSLLVLHAVGVLFFLFFVYLVPGGKSPLPWYVAINAAISFVTNTNWQSYAGEVALTPWKQMLGPTVQNFLSAGTGIAVMAALARGLRQRLPSSAVGSVGNFYVDLTRTVFYILLPLSILFSFILMSEGVVQTLHSKVRFVSKLGTVDVVNSANTVNAVNATNAVKEIPLGPVASQVAIKQLGSNGGGFFNANGAHPFENPTPLSNFLQMLAIFLLPWSLIFTFGELLHRRKHALMLFGVMFGIWLLGLAVSLHAELRPNPAWLNLPFWEGKEWRNGIVASTLWTSITSASSNGSVNAMISSQSPLTGLVAMFQIMLGEIIFGGVGSGIYGMVIFVLLTVFLSGLMVGRTPEYLHKKIDIWDMKLVMYALILPNITILLGAAFATWTTAGLAGRSALGPHGLSEILYAFASATGNNGSAFAGLKADSFFYSMMISVAMLLGRFGVLIPSLLLASSFAKKKLLAEGPGHLSTESMTFGVLLASVIFIVGALTFLPALFLGPVMEHLLHLQGISF